MADAKVRVTLGADTRDYTAGMQQAAAATAKVDAAAGGLTKASKAGRLAMVAYGGAMAFVGTQAAQVLISGLNDAAKAAASLQDATQTMERTFGTASRQVKAFGNDSVTNLKMSRRATYEAATTIGELGKNAGLSESAAAGFSTKMVELAAAMADFKNTTPEEALTAITQALNGGTQGVARYGVVINDAVLRQRAFSMDLIASEKTALTPYARALAVQAELLAQTTTAQDLARDSINSLSDAQQRYTAQLEETQAELGQALSPLLTWGYDRVSDVLKAIGDAGLGVIPVIGPWLDLAFGAEDAADAMLAVSDASRIAGSAVGVAGLDAALAANGFETLADAAESAMGGMNSAIDLAQRLMATGNALAGVEAGARASATSTVPSTGGSAGRTKADTAAREANAKALQKQIDALRKKANAEKEEQIESARAAAQRRAERRADREAQRDVRAGIAGAIATDKAARRGEDIDGFNQTGTVGEYTGRLTKKEQAALDEKISRIRERSNAALAKQIKALRDANRANLEAAKATAGAAASATVYNATLDKGTEAGRRNIETLSGYVDEAQARADAVYQTALLSGASIPEAAAAWAASLRASYREIVDGYQKAGYEASEVEATLKRLKLTPHKIDVAMRLLLDITDVAKKVAKTQEVINKLKANARMLDDPQAQPTPASVPPVQGPSSYPWTSRTTIRGKGAVRFATGGEVAGPAGVDRVPIWATRGEFVVNDRQYAANRDLVRAINEGNGRVSASTAPLVGSITVQAAKPDRAGRSVIDSLAEVAYRHGVVR